MLLGRRTPRRLAAAVMSALSKSTRVIPVSNFDAKISSMIVAYAFDLDMVNYLVGYSYQPSQRSRTTSSRKYCRLAVAIRVLNKSIAVNS